MRSWLQRLRGGKLAARVEIALLLGLVVLAAWVAAGAGASSSRWSLALHLLPALVGFQHGFVPAGLAVALTAAVGTASGLVARYETLQPVLAPMLGPFGLALLAGHYRDRARRARAQLAQRVAEQASQLEQLFRSHHVLRASHAQLEERLAAEDWSLEAAVREASRQVSERDFRGAAAAVLELLSVQGRVGGAALYLARGERLPFAPDAWLGLERRAADSRSALIRRAFRRGTMVSVQTFAASADDVLLAIPLVSTRGSTVGVVAIHELPFVLFHDPHFQLLAALLALFADPLADKLVEGADTAAPAPTPLPPPTRALALLEEREGGREG